MSGTLRDAIHDAVWDQVCDYVSAARVNRVVDVILAIAEAQKAAAMQPLLELAESHERYAEACEADARDRWTGSHWAQEAHKARDEAKRIRHAIARGLATEAGITVDTTTEEKP